MPSLSLLVCGSKLLFFASLSLRGRRLGRRLRRLLCRLLRRDPLLLRLDLGLLLLPRRVLSRVLGLELAAELRDDRLDEEGRQVLNRDALRGRGRQRG